LRRVSDTSSRESISFSDYEKDKLNNASYESYMCDSEISDKSDYSNDGENFYQITINVIDTGIGIDPSDRDKLFKIFSQIDQSQRKFYQGTGLGLAISKQLSELLNGELTLLNSIPGSGSIFSLSLKVQEYIQPDFKLYKPILSNKKVLLVDDHELNRRTIGEMLFKWGMQPIVCSCGSDALVYLKNGINFDMALIDIQMPGMDGFQLARKIKNNKHTFPLVAMSSLGQEIKDPNFILSVNKPVSEDGLLVKIIDIISGDYTHKETLSINCVGAHKMEYQSGAILIAEDIVINQKVMTEMLQIIGYNKIDIASDGQEVIDMMKSNPDKYKVILLDLKMPKKNGLEVAEILRTTYNDRCPVLIAITAMAMKGDKELCLRQGQLDEYLTKPVEFDKLKEILEKYI
jgi:CheY-like chemotaxis protein